MRVRHLPLWITLALSVGVMSGLPAFAKASQSMTTCSAQYKADKASGALPAGQTWPQYLSACAARLGGTQAAVAPTVTTKPPKLANVASPKASKSDAGVLGNLFGATTTKAAAGAATNGMTQTPAQKAMYDRERQCGQMWKASKVSGSIPSGQTWPQYWSQCNARLKG